MSIVIAYLAERFPLAVFAPAFLLIVGAVTWSMDTVTNGAIARTSLLALVLVVQFRLWDDMEDADRDRVTHPERILVRSPARPFRVLHVALLIAAGAACATRPPAFIAFISLEAAFWWTYRHLRRHISEDAWRFGAVLMKYPGLMVVLSLAAGAVSPLRLALAATAAYICASAYELWHTERTHDGSPLR